jgi:uroporphyrinogen-III synthase
LSELGADVIHIPAFQIVPHRNLSGVDAAIHRMADGPGYYSWVGFTSANAVRAFCERVLALGYDARLFAGTRIAAVGSATAESLQEYTLSADFLPGTFRGADLGAELDIQNGERVLLPQSAKALPDLAQALLNRGAQVQAVTAYEHVPTTPELHLLESLAQSKPDLWVFFSPSAVTALLERLGEAKSDKLRLTDLKSTPAACIGPTTAAAAVEAGFDVQIIPERYTAEGLLEAIIAWRARL